MTNDQAPAAPKRIEHHGGECPVSPGTRVRVWMKGGETRDLPADICQWKHFGWSSDILTYEILSAPTDWAVEGPRLVDALKRLSAKYRNCAMAHGNSAETVDSSMEFARALLDRIDGGATKP